MGNDYTAGWFHVFCELLMVYLLWNGKNMAWDYNSDARCEKRCFITQIVFGVKIQSNEIALLQPSQISINIGPFGLLEKINENRRRKSILNNSWPFRKVSFGNW